LILIFFDQRCEHILQLLEVEKIDIICLQEVVPSFIEKLKNVSWVQEFYYMSNVNIEGTAQYGSIMLTTIPPKVIKRWQLPTTMGRDCLEAKFLINGQCFSFATTHLESLDFPQKRKEQLYVISQILQNYPSAALLGDFNFDSEQNYSHLESKREAIGRGMPIDLVESIPTPSEPIENDCIKIYYNNYKDIWVDCGLNDPITDKGYTYDSVKNRMIRGYERMRYDRILLKSTCWIPTAISLLGVDPVPPFKVGGAIVYPSDHFGLITTLEFKKQ